jgi:hypothetical protein
MMKKFNEWVIRYKYTSGTDAHLTMKTYTIRNKVSLAYLYLVEYHCYPAVQSSSTAHLESMLSTVSNTVSLTSHPVHLSSIY